MGLAKRFRIKYGMTVIFLDSEIFDNLNEGLLSYIVIDFRDYFDGKIIYPNKPEDIKNVENIMNKLRKL